MVEKDAAFVLKSGLTLKVLIEGSMSDSVADQSWDIAWLAQESNKASPIPNIPATVAWPTYGSGGKFSPPRSSEVLKSFCDVICSSNRGSVVKSWFESSCGEISNSVLGSVNGGNCEDTWRPGKARCSGDIEEEQQLPPGFTELKE